MRGAEANHLLVLLDGIALNDPALGSEFNFGTLDFAGIRRVEYLAGPQSAVWGGDALAGVLYLDTKPRRNTKRLSLGVGSHGTVDADAEFARVTADRHAALAIGSVASDGTNPAAMGGEDDGFANTTAQVNLGAVRDRWTASVAARLADTDVDYDPTPGPLYLPTDGDRNARGRTALILGTLRFNASDEIRSWLTVASSRDRNRQYADGASTDGTVGRRDTATFGTNLHFDVQHVNVTAEFERERIEQTGTAGPFGDPNQRQRINARGFATEYQVEVGRFTVSAPPSARTLAGSPMSGAASRIRRSRSASASRRTPSSGTPDLRPETSTGFETGIVLTRAKTTASLVYFDTTLHDEIDGFFFDPGRGGFTARNIDGKSRRRGAEATLATRLGPIALSAVYAYVDSTADNVREPRRPRHLGNVDARMEITPSVSASVGVAVGARRWTATSRPGPPAKSNSTRTDSGAANSTSHSHPGGSSSSVPRTCSTTITSRCTATAARRHGDGEGRVRPVTPDQRNQHRIGSRANFSLRRCRPTCGRRTAIRCCWRRRS